LPFATAWLFRIRDDLITALNYTQNCSSHVEAKSVKGIDQATDAASLMLNRFSRVGNSIQSILIGVADQIFFSKCFLKGKIPFSRGID
jgi:hypothetical protein